MEAKEKRKELAENPYKSHQSTTRQHNQELSPSNPSGRRGIYSGEWKGTLP